MTLLHAAVALMAVGTLSSAAAAQRQGEAAAQAAAFNSQVAKRNATLAIQQSQQDAEAQRRLAYKKIGGAVAAYGASGVTLEGSPLDVLEESVRNAEQDRQTILYKGQLRAMGYESDAALYEFSGENARATGNETATGILLSGGAQIAGTLGRSSSPAQPQGGYRLNEYTAAASRPTGGYLDGL